MNGAVAVDNAVVVEAVVFVAFSDSEQRFCLQIDLCHDLPRCSTWTAAWTELAAMDGFRVLYF